MNIIQKLKVRWYLFKVRFSLDAYLRKHKAVAKIHFIEGEDYGTSIKLIVGNMTYFFEGVPKFSIYKNADGKTVRAKTLKYGGWEREMNNAK